MMRDLSQYNQAWYDRGRHNLVVLLWWLVQGTIFRYSIHNMYKFRSCILRMFGAKVGKNVKIRATAKFHYPWKVEIGHNSWIGDNVQLYSLDYIKIGANTVVSQNTYINTGSHDISDEKFSLITKPVLVSDCVWIASNCFINLGVIIGENSVVGCMSNVIKSISANKFAAGNPCREIRSI